MDQYQDFVRIVDIKTFCPQFGSRSPIKVHLNSGLENTYWFDFLYNETFCLFLNNKLNLF